MALVEESGKPWPQGPEDTDEYRKARAVDYFNKAARVANDLIELKPTMLSWVPHIMVFIVPRQMVELGDPARRSCDACESFGAMVKKLIKHNTCRRRLKRVEHEHKKYAGSSVRRWKQTFTRGYIQTAFTRACVREQIRHGAENLRYLQRIDAQRASLGKARTSKQVVEQGEPKLSIREAAAVYAPPEQGCRAVGKGRSGGGKGD